MLIGWLIASGIPIAVLAFALGRRRARSTSDVGDLTELQRLVDTIDAPVAIVETGLVKAANRALVNALGHPEDRLVGRKFESLCELGLLTAGDFEVTTASGESRIFAKSEARPIRIGERRLDVVTMRDVTEDRTRALFGDQRDRLATLGTLVASTMHEVRNPLTAMALNLEAAARSTAALFDNKRGSGNVELIAEIIEDIRQDVERMTALTSDLSALAAPQKEALMPTDVAECAQVAVRALQAQAKGVAKLVADLSAVSLVVSSESRIRQILINLVNNALHAVREQPQSAIITIRTREVGGAVVLEVEDNGPGIPDAIRERIFDPMFTTKAHGAGTGLGLHIVARVAKSIGADVTVDAHVGVGTTFTIRFREIMPRSKSGRLVVLPSVADAPKARILVVDDQVSFMNRICKNLEAYEVTLARNGEEAIDLLSRRDFDAVLLDLIMPTPDGRDVYRYVERRNPDNVRRICFMTGLSNDTELLEWVRAEGLTFVRKPFDPQATVSALLGR